MNEQAIKVASKLQSGNGMTFDQENNSTKLFGRDKEISALLDAFTTSLRSDDTSPGMRNPQQLVFIRGSSGTGKTALASSLRSLVKSRGGFYLSGKFESTGQQRPFSTFEAAFTPLIEELLNEERQAQSDEPQTQNSRLSQIREVIREAVAAEGRLLTDMIPALEMLIGLQEEVMNMTGTEALHRFQYVFCKFCHAISTVFPIFLFFDDLQRADQGSLALLEDLLRTESKALARGCLLVVATYRDDEASQRNAISQDDEESPSDSSFQQFIHQVRLLASSALLQIHAIVLGVDIPSNPSDLAIVRNFVKTSTLLFGKSDTTILSLPLMRDEKKLTAVHILNVLVLYAVQSGSPMLPLIATKLVQLSLKYGLSKGCAHGFALYAFLVARFSKRQCYRFGRLAVAMVEKLRAREMIPCVHSVAYFECNHWVHPLKESFAPLKKCIQIGLDLGDVEYVCLTSMFLGTLAAYSGMSLTKAQQFLVAASDRMTRYKQNNFLQIVNVHLQATHALLREDAPLTNTIQELAVGDPNLKVASIYRYSWGATLAYYIGDYSQAEVMTQKRIGLNFELYAEYTYASDMFYQGLIAIAQARSSGVRRRRRHHVKVCKQSLKMLKGWAKDCPDNFRNKQLLLEAELRTLKPQRMACIETNNNMYGRAYDLATRQGFTQEAALACELAGNYMQTFSHETLAVEYWKKAHTLYSEWGGLAKVIHLIQDKGDFLTTPQQPLPSA